VHQINNVSLSLEIDQFSPYSDLIYSDKSYRARINGFILCQKVSTVSHKNIFCIPQRWYSHWPTRINAVSSSPLLYLPLWAVVSCYQVYTHTIMELQATFLKKSKFIPLEKNLSWPEVGMATVGFWCQTIHEKFLRRFDTISGLKIMVKSGLEKIILKFNHGLQSCCCPVQKNLPREAELAWQVSRFLWRPPWNFKIIFSRTLFTIIFKPKMVSNLCKNFSCIAWH
jgi:hypothetical protein